MKIKGWGGVSYFRNLGKAKKITRSSGFPNKNHSNLWFFLTKLICKLFFEDFLGALFQECPLVFQKLIWYLMPLWGRLGDYSIRKAAGNKYDEVENVIDEEFPECGYVGSL